MVRILHVLGGLERGGAETMVMNLYRNIDRSNIQFDFIIHTTEKQAYYQEISHMGGKIYHFPAFNGKNIFFLKNKWARFFTDHPEYKILHSHVRSYASLYLPIAKKHGLKTIIHSHSTSNGKGVLAVVKRFLQFPLRYQADYLIACSDESGKWLYGTKACKKHNYMLIPNAIDTEKYRFSEQISNAYRKKMNIENRFVIGHVGRFHEAKNHMFLLDVFAGVCAKRSDAVLLLVGDGSLRKNIQNKIHSLKLNDRVILTGSRNDVPQLMQAMDVFIFPSLWEGLPVTVVEAQAAGLPCLISDRITSGVDLSKLVMRLPVDDPYVWVKAILNLKTKRSDVTTEIKRAGFDIKDSATDLTEFYLSISEDV